MIMFESIEIRKVKNGFLLTLNTEDGNEEYVFDSSRKALKFIRDYIEAKPEVK
jgi:hypothetical protein